MCHLLVSMLLLAQASPLLQFPRMYRQLLKGLSQAAQIYHLSLVWQKMYRIVKSETIIVLLRDLFRVKSLSTFRHLHSMHTRMLNAGRILVESWQSVIPQIQLHTNMLTSVCQAEHCGQLATLVPIARKNTVTISPGARHNRKITMVFSTTVTMIRMV